MVFNPAPFWLLDLCTSEARFQPMPQDGSAGRTIFTNSFFPHNFYITKNEPLQLINELKIKSCSSLSVQRIFVNSVSKSEILKNKSPFSNFREQQHLGCEARIGRQKQSLFSITFLSTIHRFFSLKFSHSVKKTIIYILY